MHSSLATLYVAGLCIPQAALAYAHPKPLLKLPCTVQVQLPYLNAQTIGQSLKKIRLRGKGYWGAQLLFKDREIGALLLGDQCCLTMALGLTQSNNYLKLENKDSDMQGGGEKKSLDIQMGNQITAYQLQHTTHTNLDLMLGLRYYNPGEIGTKDWFIEGGVRGFLPKLLGNGRAYYQPEDCKTAYTCSFEEKNAWQGGLYFKIGYGKFSLLIAWIVGSANSFHLQFNTEGINPLFCLPVALY